MMANLKSASTYLLSGPFHMFSCGNCFCVGLPLVSWAYEIKRGISFLSFHWLGYNKLDQKFERNSVEGEGKRKTFLYFSWQINRRKGTGNSTSERKSEWEIMDLIEIECWIGYLLLFIVNIKMARIQGFFNLYQVLWLIMKLLSPIVVSHIDRTS
jgi:hypothetical protein